MNSDDDLRYGADRKVGMGIAVMLAGMVFGGIAAILVFFKSPEQAGINPITLGFCGISIVAVTSGLVLIRYGREQCVILGRETVTVQTVVSRRHMGISDIVQISRSNDRTVLTGRPDVRPPTLVVDDSFFATIDERKRFLELLEQRTGLRVDDGSIIGLWCLDAERTLNESVKPGSSPGYSGNGKNGDDIGGNANRLSDALILDVSETFFVLGTRSDGRAYPFQVASSSNRMVKLNVQTGQSTTCVTARIVDRAFLVMESEPPLVDTLPRLVWKRPPHPFGKT